MFSANTVSPAGPKSCLTIRVRGESYGQDGWVEVNPEEEIAVTLPVELEIRVGGQDRVEACEDWLTENLQSGAEEPLRALWLGAWLSDRLNRGGFLHDLNTVSYKDRFTLEKLRSAEGGSLRVSHENLPGEHRAFLYLRVAPGAFDAREELLDDEVLETSVVRLHVLDTRPKNTVGWRLAVPFLLRERRFNPGLAGAGLYYPMRRSPRVKSWLLRDLSLEVALGFADEANGAQIERFFLLGAGVSWKEFIGVGYAFDFNERGSSGLYFDLTIISGKGVFGLIPYKEIVKAFRAALFSNEKSK